MTEKKIKKLELQIQGENLMSNRRHKVHFSRQPGINLCGSPRRGYAESNLSEVTCGNCLRLASNKTTEQGGPKDPQYQVFLLKNGLNRINVIKVIREHTSLGLKESKDLSDMAYDNETLLLAGAGRERALRFVNELTFVGATVRLDNSIGGSEFFYPTDNTNPKSSVQTSIETAYSEMLRLFFPQGTTDHTAYLNSIDDNELTGQRTAPTCSGNATIADLRRWLAAGGVR